MYDFLVEGYQRKVGRDSGVEYLEIPFKIVNHAKESGKVVVERFSIKETAIWKLEALLIAVGFTGASYDTDDDKWLTKTLVDRYINTRLETRPDPRGGSEQRLIIKGMRAAAVGNTKTAAKPTTTKNSSMTL